MMDFLLGRLEKGQEEAFQERIETEEPLRSLQEDVTNTLQALDRLPEAEPPADLTEKTLARIRQDQQMKAILARQEVNRRVFRPTFSLRELGAVAAVAMIMAAVFIPSMREARRNGLITDCRANMGQIGTALESFSSANNGQLPVADLSKRRWLFQAPEAASNSAALFQLVQHGYTRPPVFQCPAVGGSSFAVKGGMVDFPAPEYVNYSYQHSLGGKAVCLNDPCRSGVEPQMAILADATPVFDGGAFHADRANDQIASVNHDGRGQNVLFLDWHVDWAQKPTVGVGDNNIFLVDNVYTYKGDEAPAGPKDSFLLPAYSAGPARQP